jgi:hypothetical protein
MSLVYYKHNESSPGRVVPMRPSETSQCGRGRRELSSRVCLETQEDKGVSPGCSTTGANRPTMLTVMTVGSWFLDSEFSVLVLIGTRPGGSDS